MQYSTNIQIFKYSNSTYSITLHLIKPFPYFFLLIKIIMNNRDYEVEVDLVGDYTYSGPRPYYNK